jgi:hypothetical protein
MILASVVAAALRNAPMMYMTRRKRQLPMLFTRWGVLTNVMDAVICVPMDQLPISAMRRVGRRQTCKLAIFKHLSQAIKPDYRSSEPNKYGGIQPASSD